MGDNAPQFFEPKFADKVYEAGGPRARLAQDGVMILSVTIEGNKSVSESMILSVMQSRPERNFDQGQFNQDIAALYRTEMFRKIESYSSETPEGVHLKLVVQEHPIVLNVYFTGNKAIEDRTLRKHAAIELGDPRDPISINAAKSRLIEYYQDQGFNQVDIQIVSGLNPSESTVNFYISEGPLERIRSIKFLGNQKISTEWLKAKIKTKIYPIILPPKYADHKPEEDRQFILNHYRGMGYFDAKVDIRRDFDDDGSRVDMTFIIYEGEQYFVESVSIAGTKLYKPEELLSYMRLKSKEPFSIWNKAKDERFLRDLYGVQGHHFCDVVGEVIYKQNNLVDVVYNVGEGDIYRISDIRIHLDGDHTKTRVAIPPLGPLKPGSILNSRHLDAASRRLQYQNLWNVNPMEGTVPTIKVEPPEDLVPDDY
jgi:outer membrane protein insertion porin family